MIPAPEATPADGARPQVRAARVTDLDALLRLEAMFPTDAMSRRTLRRLLSRPSARVWVAVKEQIVVGSTVLLVRRNSDVARLYSLAVDAGARGHGIGARLIAHAEAAARSLHKRAITLEVRPDNAIAIRLYQHLGYREAGRLAAFYEDDSDALRMRHALG